jgi:transcriptional regulator with XRE-family HTH domain
MAVAVFFQRFFWYAVGSRHILNRRAQDMNAGWFAGRLKELREQAGLTQHQLGEKAALSHAGIADLEQGRRKPAWETVVALCQALAVSPEAFLQEPQVLPEPRRGRPRKLPAQGPGEGQEPPTKRPRGRRPKAK